MIPLQGLSRERAWEERALPWERELTEACDVEVEADVPDRLTAFAS